MFPFLAVLLCTIGALVLILVISVVHSHASAKRDLDDELQERVEQAKEQSDYLQTISEELAARREKTKQEIDRRRKELANVEDHIQRLKAQMDQLRAQAEGIESIDNRDHQVRSDREEKIQELKIQIEKKRFEIEDEVQKSKTRKPAFAIIPYEGPNGTSRRPVYLECRADGVVIQPEGICISIRDLRPPYGPGNPLDAALRVLRTAYQQRDATFGLTIPPYPLLVVRPDGIHSYAMARAAMSGWDDQFGYELIDADMPLVFPPGVPNLKEELLTTLDTARQRQESLVAALPRQYARAREMEDIDLESLTPDSFGQSPERPGTEASTGKDAGDWKMIDEFRGGGIASGGSSSGTATPLGSGAKELNPTQLMAQGATLPSDSSSNAVGTGLASNLGSAPNPGLASDAGNSSLSFSNRANNSNAFNGSSGATASSGAGDSAGAGGSAGGGAAGAMSGTSAPSQSTSQSTASRANAFSSGTANGSSPQTINGSDGPSNPESEAMATAMKEMQNKEEMNRENAATSQTNNGKTPEGSSKPIASSRGKGWAMPGKDPKATPVTRPIRIVVLEDRWLVRKEGSETQFDAEIDVSSGPIEAGSTLEKAIRNRVDSWGLSLPGGYWCPSITIESASDAQRSVHRLQHMLEGSGVEIRVVPLQAPPQKKASLPLTPNRR